MFGNFEKPFIVPVGKNPTLLSEGGATLCVRYVRNSGATSIFLGDADVATSGENKGFELAPGQIHTDEYAKNPLYAAALVTGKATVEVSVWETKG